MADEKRGIPSLPAFLKTIIRIQESFSHKHIRPSFFSHCLLHINKYDAEESTVISKFFSDKFKEGTTHSDPRKSTDLHRMRWGYGSIIIHTPNQLSKHEVGVLESNQLNPQGSIH